MDVGRVADQKRGAVAVLRNDAVTDAVERRPAQVADLGFCRDHRRDGFRELYIQNVHEKTARRLTVQRGQIHTPAWSPALPPSK